VDEHGLPRRIALTAGQAHDNRAVPALLADLPSGADVVADRSYDANATLGLIGAAGARAHIPTPRRRKVQRSVDPALYRRRNLIERCFCKLKHNRGVATRYAKLARNYLAALCLAAVRLWTRFESTT
jgi:transposase